MQQYTEVDEKIANSVKIRFSIAEGVLADESARDIFPILKGEPIPFQFPPKVSGISKVGKWGDLNKGGEGNLLLYGDEFKVWNGAESKSLQLEWTYIVDGSSKWNPITISKVLHGVFGILTISGADQQKAMVSASASGVIVIIDSLYDIVSPGASGTTWRAESISVEPSGAKMLIPWGGEQYTMHLKNTITMQLKAWTRGGDNTMPQGYLPLQSLQVKPSAWWF